MNREEYIAEALIDKVNKWAEKRQKNSTVLKKINSKNPISAKLAPKVYIDIKTKEIVIHNINFDKFIFRIKEMYKYKGILNLFDKRYSTWDIHMWYAQKISKADMTIKDMRVPMFFSLELYKIFQDLYEFYRYSAYRSIAIMIYNSTWISNFEKIKPTYTDISRLSNLQYTLKPFQAEFVRQYSALKQLYDLEGYILSFEQGLGKTLTAVALTECLNKDQIIIVCPNSLKENWANEIYQYYKKYTDNINLLYQDIYINNSKTFKAKNPKYIIVNQENIPAIYSIVKPNKNSIIIVDECHNFRNIEAERVKALLKLKDSIKCTDNLLMSGTPIKATPNELAPALRMIDPYFTEDVCFRYVKSFNSYTEEISRVVRERFSRIIYKQTKDQVLQLPEKNIYQAFLPVKNETPFLVSTVRNQIKEDFYKEYELMYKDIAIYKDKYEKLVMKYSSASKSDTMEYLRYLSDDLDVHESLEEKYDKFLNIYVYPNIKNPNDMKLLKEFRTKYIYIYNSAMGKAIGRNLPPAKEKCYITILNENTDFFVEKIKSATKKTVIFTPFLGVAKHASSLLGSKGVNNVLITGGDSKNRFNLITEFKESDTIDLMIATVQTLSTGVTLTEANQMIFLGVPYRDADFEQACDRIHRIGQTTDVDIYIVLLKSNQENISTRIEKIMTWSGDAFNDFMDI